MSGNTAVSRVKDIGNRDATELSNGRLRVVVCDDGGMVPELSVPYGYGMLNAHWVPHFRSNSGTAFDEVTHSGFWPVKLLFDLAGNFPCMPNFGPPNTLDGIDHHAHGITANGMWEATRSGVDTGGAAFQVAKLDGAGASLHLKYTKFDVLMPNQPVHYAVIDVENTSDDVQINAAWHNTVAAPFLSPGCLIDSCADRFATAPQGGEFDDTGRLAMGAEFDDLTAAPLRAGGMADLRVVPGMIGFSDFATGAVPESFVLGWSSVVNPALNMCYLSFFKGPAAGSKTDLKLNFTDFWMQYGGRRFPPWASYEGGTDYTFCLGAENATGGYANGLSYALEHPEILGRPTTLPIAKGETKRLVYGTAFFAYENGSLDRGVENVEWSDSGLVVSGRGGGTATVPASTEFTGLEKFIDSLD